MRGWCNYFRHGCPNGLSATSTALPGNALSAGSANDTQTELGNDPSSPPGKSAPTASRCSAREQYRSPDTATDTQTSPHHGQHQEQPTQRHEHGEDAMKVARPVRRPGRGNPSMERLTGRPGPTPTLSARDALPWPRWSNAQHGSWPWPRCQEGRTAELLNAAVSRQLSQFPSLLRRSLTWDQGKEIAGHAALAAATGLDVYLCDRSSPWQRGTKENTNGLLRQWWPRSTNFYTLDRGEIQRVQTSLNARPRHTLGWQTPAAALELAV